MIKQVSTEQSNDQLGVHKNQETLQNLQMSPRVPIHVDVSKPCSSSSEEDDLELLEFQRGKSTPKFKLSSVDDTIELGSNEKVLVEIDCFGACVD